MDSFSGPSSRPYPQLHPSLSIASSSNFDIRVKLTSLGDPQHTRYLTFSPNRPCIIGRASKNKGEAHEATPTNGLFDCPVVSRRHAELRAHPWASSGDQVTIVDNGSMHGTKVNNKKLEMGRSMALRNGDVIEIGDHVTRGDETHKSVLVTYQRLPNEDSLTLAQSLQARSTGYRGDYISEDEDEDYGGSDRDEYSVISDDDEYEFQYRSSAKTTPEQPKVGSQQNPIQLESVQPAPIDLTGDDDVAPPSLHSLYHQPHSPEQLVEIELFDPVTGKGSKSSQPQVFDSNKIIEDSVNNKNSFYAEYEPRALADVARKPNLKIASAGDNYQSIQQQGVSGVIHVDDAEDISPNVSSEAEDMNGADDIEIQDGDEENREEDVNLDEDVDDDNVDIIEMKMYEGVEEELDEDEEEEADSLYDSDSNEPDKERSPELGSDTGFIGEPSSTPKQPTTSFDGTSRFEQQQAPFDFGPPRPPHVDFAPPRPPHEPFSPPPPACGYSAGFGRGSFPHLPHSTFADPHTHTAVSTNGINPARSLGPVWSPPGGTICVPPHPPPMPRWQGQVPPVQPMHGWAAFPSSHYMPPPPPPPFRPMPPVALRHEMHPTKPDTSPANDPVEPKTMSTPDQTYKSPRVSERNRMSIDKLVEEEGTTSKDSTSEQASSSRVAGSKRKADEISTENLMTPFYATEDRHDTSTDDEFDENEALATGPINERAEALLGIDLPMIAEEPTSRRRRLSVEDDVSTAVPVAAPEVVEEVQEVQAAPRARTVAGTFAKMAGSAVLGGAATMAFLCSPLAEAAIEWLA